MGGCFSDVRGGKQAAGVGLTGPSMSPMPISDATLNDAVDHFFRARRLHQLFTQVEVVPPVHFVVFFCSQTLIFLFFSILNVFFFQPHIGSNPNFCDFILFSATANPAAAAVERGHLLKNAASVHGEPLPRHTTFINEGEYLTSHLGARRELPSSIPAATVTTASAYPRDPYYSTYSSVPVDTYPPPPRREEVRAGSYFLSGRAEPYLGETDRMRMREADALERIYSTYASDAPLKYDQIHHYQKARPEPGNVPVSSLYSFAGPSSFRP
ncbi:uncharacterized protein LOC132255107 [Vitis vinifera]|uniref:uncharacterized protein LOC132255107 n=1 Tax=Vitis vinifera TaxID=29760 RepID=UPI002882ECB7|nr:uncharacterized protein LOC132255107 [Vitis vinifera]